MRLGELVKIECDNKFLDKKVGTLLLNEDDDGFVYGTCVMIDGAVYGFSKQEVKLLTDDKKHR